MKKTRRSFLAAAGLGMLVPKQVLAREESRGRPSILHLLRNHETALPAERPDPAHWDDTQITAAWIGHTTVLLNFFGTRIITDPVFSERIGISLLGLFTLGPKRLVQPAMSIGDLPPLDLVLLSHAHMDHMDFPSLRRLPKSVPIVVAKNTKDLILDRGWKDIRELDWGEKTAVGGLTIEALRVNHFGWRFPWDGDRSKGDPNGRSFNGYLLSKNGKHIVFGGDTAYQEYFRVLAERNIPIECAIMPIGAYNPWIRAHASPEQAVAMANHMHAKAILPVHWGTFIMSSEPSGEPIVRLKSALGQHSPSLALERVGQTWRNESGE